GRRRRPDPGRRPLLERRLNGPTGPARPDRRAYTAPMALVGARRVEEARELLRGVVTETPLLHSRALSQIVGGPVLLKCENLQRTGSFKARGAYVRIARLTEAERSRGVVAA